MDLLEPQYAAASAVRRRGDFVEVSCMGGYSIVSTESRNGMMQTMEDLKPDEKETTGRKQENEGGKLSSKKTDIRASEFLSYFISSS